MTSRIPVEAYGRRDCSSCTLANIGRQAPDTVGVQPEFERHLEGREDQECGARGVHRYCSQVWHSMLGTSRLGPLSVERPWHPRRACWHGWSPADEVLGFLSRVNAR